MENPPSLEDPFADFQKIVIPVGRRCHGARIDRYIRTRIGKFSRTKIKQAIMEGRVFLNGRIPKGATSVSVGDEIVYYATFPLPRYLPQPLPLKILYEDDHILAVHKPSGMSMHPGPGHKGDTLADGLVHYRISCGAPPDISPGTVHRLDLPTSGLVLAGKYLEASRKLSEQFAKRTLQKEYLALVWKIPPQEGLIDGPIANSPSDRFRWVVHPGGKSAQTAYQHLQTLGEFALVRALPKTGRTHQIRVHLCYAGYPILGDSLYGKENFHLFQNQIPGLPPPIRLCLHAHRLTFTHPITRERLTLEASLPDDFLSVMDRVKDFQFDEP